MGTETNTFEHVGAFKADSFNLTSSGDPVRLEGIRASAGFFPSLGGAPALGRFFRTDEDRSGYEHEVILSNPVWRDRFGGRLAGLGIVIGLAVAFAVALLACM